MAELWHFFDLVFLVGFRYWFPCNMVSFERDALISSEVYRRVYYCKIHVRFNIGNHPENFARVMASVCSCVDIGFCSVTFAGMH